MVSGSAILVQNSNVDVLHGMVFGVVSMSRDLAQILTRDIFLVRRVLRGYWLVLNLRGCSCLKWKNERNIDLSLYMCTDVHSEFLYIFIVSFTAA